MHTILKSVLARTLALALTFITGSALAATPVAVWNGDFATLTKGGVTLDLNGNDATAKRYIQISTDYGIKLTGFSSTQVTVLVGYQNLSTSDTTTDKHCLCTLGSEASDGNDDLVGAAVIPSSKEITGVYQSGWWESSSNRRAKTKYPRDTTSATEYFFAYSQDHNGNTGGDLYLSGDNGTFTRYWGNSGLKASNTALNRAAIGGPARHGTRYSGYGIVSCSGMKITRIAVFTQCLSTDELAAFKWERNWTAAQSGDWSNAENWEDGVVPQKGDTAVIPADAVVNVDAAANTTGVGVQGTGTIIVHHSGNFGNANVPSDIKLPS